MSTNKGFSSALKQAQGGRIGTPQTPERLDVQPSKRLDVQEPGPPMGQASERLDAQTSKRLEIQASPEATRVRRTVYLPPDLARWLKLHAARTEREMSEIITDALQQYRDRDEG